jgi:hypothetical protein
LVLFSATEFTEITELYAILSVASVAKNLVPSLPTLYRGTIHSPGSGKGAARTWPTVL